MTNIDYKQLETATDEELLAVIQYINTIRKQRRELKGRQLGAELAPNDRVAFLDVRPKYLAGTRATVVEKRGNKVLVRLDTPQGKFKNGTLLAPLTALRKIGSL